MREKGRCFGMSIVKIFNPKIKKYTIIDTEKNKIIGRENKKEGVSEDV